MTLIEYPIKPNEVIEIAGLSLKCEKRYGNIRVNRYDLNDKPAIGYEVYDIIKIGKHDFFIVDEEGTFKWIDYDGEKKIEFAVWCDVSKYITDFQTAFKWVLRKPSSKYYLHTIRLNRNDKFIQDLFGKPLDDFINVSILFDRDNQLIARFEKIRKIIHIPEKRNFIKSYMYYSLPCYYNTNGTYISNIRLKEPITQDELIKKFDIDDKTYKAYFSEYYIILSSRNVFKKVICFETYDWTYETSYWKIYIKPLVKFLSLQKRAVERVNHPDRLKLSGVFEEI